jgi:hypothetical protein
MRVTNIVVRLFTKLVDRLDPSIVKTRGEQPDAAAASARATQHQHEVSMSKCDTAAAGFPPEIR